MPDGDDLADGVRGLQREGRVVCLVGGAFSSDGLRAADCGIGVHDLASVVLGSLRVRDVVRHRLAAVEPARALDMVDAAFRADQPPYCTTRF